MKLISLVFSFKNEESNLKELVSRVHQSLIKLNNWKYELIFVNDDSDDGSEKILLELQKTYPITIINMSRTFGEMPCFIAGFKNNSGDVMVYMPSDLQDPPELIPNLISEYEKGYDIVHTIRTNRLGESKLKMAITTIAYKIINFFSDINLPINAGDFKLISKRALKNILNQKEFRLYMRGVSVWVGFKQTYVEYVRQPRFAGETKYPLLSAGPIKEFINGITSYSLKPLYVGFFLGLLSFLIAFIIIIYSFLMKINGHNFPEFALVHIAISIFSGLILFTLGVLGTYIARIFEETRSRENYIIKEIIKPNSKNE